MLPQAHKGAAMNQHVKLNRRAFVIGTATAGAGLAVGLDLPFGGPAVVRAAVHMAADDTSRT